MNFVSAYRQLQPAEKQFTDGFVSALETRAVRLNRRIIDLLEEHPVERQATFLDRPLVRAAIAERVKDIQDAADLTAYRVLKELQAVAFSNLQDYMTTDTTVLEGGYAANFITFDLSKCTREQMAAVASVEVDYDATGMIAKKIKFKLHDKVAGLDRFMRYMGLLDPDNPHYRAETVKTKQPLGLPVATTQSQAADAYAKFIEG